MFDEIYADKFDDTEFALRIDSGDLLEQSKKIRHLLFSFCKGGYECRSYPSVTTPFDVTRVIDNPDGTFALSARTIGPSPRT